MYTVVCNAQQINFHLYVKQKNALRYFEHMIEKDTMHKNSCINRSNVHLEIDTLHIAKNQEINAINHIIKICISDNVEKGEAEVKFIS
ncbi:hypothetical protein T09_3122 [Trichinella sp. T9]|nr:hypothetical protein T09_3122 [Trichinella sp. T9]